MKKSTPLPECCCVIVLYEPALDIELKIHKYSQLFPFLCVVDNSPVSFIGKSLNATIPEEKVLFVHNANQGGIAKALNIGVEEAEKRGFKRVMTLDQDSELTEDMLEKMWEAFKYNENENIALVSPYQVINQEEIPVDLPDYEFPLFVMTSGNILDVVAFKIVGPFDEDLVIDYVDHDYCLRLQIEGFKIIKVNKAFLKHKLGNGRFVSFLGRSEYVSDHPPIRRYYISRNRLFVAFKYRQFFPAYFFRELRLFLRDVLIIICLEKQKIEKIAMILRGIKDFVMGHMGKLNSNYMPRKEKSGRGQDG